MGLLIGGTGSDTLHATSRGGSILIGGSVRNEYAEQSEYLAEMPQEPLGRFGRPLFQTMSYHDTPEPPLPEMRYVDRSATPGSKHEYRVIVINGAGLKSLPSSSVSPPTASVQRPPA